jgi:hypothetical protein
VARRRSFDPEEAPAAFWQRDDVRLSLAHREIGTLFATYLRANPDCTQTRLAVLTEHDRSDISNFVRGVRAARVADIDVLTRVADGLAMPDAARVLLGLAPAHSAPRAGRRPPSVVASAMDDPAVPPTVGPRIWNIAAPVRGFLGRDQEMTRIGACLREQSTGGAAASAAVISGIAGIGKTQLARAYAEQHRGDYRIGWWVTAETHLDAVAGLSGKPSA